MKINYWHEFDENHFYHIYNHSVSDDHIFITKRDYQDFLLKCRKYLDPVFEFQAYCLMPNHFHLCVKVRTAKEILQHLKNDDSIAIQAFKNNSLSVDGLISDQFRRFLSSYALSFNFHHKRRGQVFLKKYKRILLNENKLLYMMCYIHHNPIHHGFCKNYKDWIYSSYNDFTVPDPSGKYKKILIERFDSIKEFYRIHDNFELEKEEDLNIDNTL